MNARTLAVLVLVGSLMVACKHGSSPKEPPPPPPPAIAAPDPTAPIDLQEAYSWLYAGPNATQIGVTPGAVDRMRICLVHGRAIDEAGQPLPSVRVEVVGAPELGYTRSDLEGRWTLVVNGGTELELRLTAADRAPSQRQVNPGWRGQYTLEPVVLVSRSGTATPVTADASVAQLVVGEVSSDDDGQRRALLFVPAGTLATAELPSGQLQNLPVFTVRATEYTVGERGPDRMPADFAGNIAYTYAIEYVCDEAEALGAVTVRFSRPLVHYVENFLDFPVGSPVPTGFYDQRKRTWVAANDGLVVHVLDVQNGRAVLDVLGGGAPATPAQLTSLGITDAELQQIATVHGAGTELWRVRLEHFTPWDCNWPYGPPADAEAPRVEPPGNGTVFDAETEDQDTACGSIVLVQDQVLVESVEMPGAGMRLVYRSDRARGFRSRTRVALTGEALPPGLSRITFVAEIAGRRFEESFPPVPRLVHELVWDGRDWRGQLLQGRQRATISIGYVYDATYQQPAQLQRTFGQFSGVPMTANRARQEITLWQHMQGLVGGFDARGLGLGGWTLDAHHVYDAEARLLLRGDGTTEGRSAKGDIIDTFAGSLREPGFSGENGPARQARMTAPSDVRIGPDGAIYFIESVGWVGGGAQHGALRRIDRDGIVTTIAGGSISGHGGDGGPATAALMQWPHQFDFAPDGSIWIADLGNHCIRRIGPDGIIATVAGTPKMPGDSGDGGPATAARLNWPMGIAIGSDGSAYVTDQFNNRVRRIGSDGTITTVAGTGDYGLTGEGGPATEADIAYPDGVVVDRQGNVYFTQLGNPVIRCVGVDGILRRIAGTGLQGHTGDGGPALAARIHTPNGLQIGIDGSLYFSEYAMHCIRRIAPDGVITTVAGTPGTKGFLGDGGKATDAFLDAPNSVCQAPDGTLYIAETLNHVIRRVQSPWPGFGAGEKVVVEADGSVLHVFDDRGRHLRTESARTTDRLLEHAYDAAGRLVAVTTEAGLVTITRDANGAVSEIVSAGGKRTLLQIDGDGLLLGVQTPDGRSLQFGYGDGGLLTRLRRADGSEQTFAYDAEGRLVRDTDAAGRTLELARTLAWDREEVAVTTSGGRTQSYETRPGPTPGEELRVRTDCCARTETSTWPDGTTEVRRANGVRVNQTLRDDPVFGSAVQLPANVHVTVPNGTGSPFELHAIMDSQVELAQPNDPRSITSRIDTTVVAGRTWTQIFDRAAGTMRWFMPSGRPSRAVLDERLRPRRFEIPGEAPVDLTYDAAGRLVAMQQSSGSTVRRTTFEYDADGNVVRLVDPSGAALAVTRDANDRLTGLSANGLIGPTLGYDAAARLGSIAPPGKPSHVLGRDAAGRLIRYTPPGGAAVVIQRDAGGLVERIDLAGEQSVTLQRQAGSTRINGFAVAAPRVAGVVAFTYEPTTGELLSATTPEGVSQSFVHNGPLPRSVQTAIPGAIPPAVTYAYNSRLLLGSLTVGSQLFTHDYDDDGLLVRIGTEYLVRDPASGSLVVRSLGSAFVEHDFAADGFGEIDRITAMHGATVHFSQSFDRDLAARITTLHDLVSGVATAYGYDSRGRLRTVHVGSALRHDLRYDDNGNPTQDAATGRAFAVDDQDRLVAAGDVTFTYDAAGRLRTRTQGGQTTTYTYDVFGNLLRVQLPTGRVIEYLVDAFNRRCRRSVDGAVSNTFVHGADGRLLAESRNGGAWRYYGYGSRGRVPDFLREGSTNYLLVHDHLGSVRRVVNVSTGAVAQSLDYDAWGNVTEDTNPGFQPFGFGGGLYDHETRLVRFGARDYAPEAMRWTSRDPSLFGGGSTNLYEYCKGDPVNRIDVEGKQDLSATGAYRGGKIVYVDGLGYVDLGSPPSVMEQIGDFVGDVAFGSYTYGRGIARAVWHDVERSGLLGCETQREAYLQDKVVQAAIAGAWDNAGTVANLYWQFGNLSVAGGRFGTGVGVGSGLVKVIGLPAIVLGPLLNLYAVSGDLTYAAGEGIENVQGAVNAIMEGGQ